MTTATDLHYLPLYEIAERIERKDVSASEVTAALLERIERLNPKLNAYITVMAESALAEARAADDEIAAGNYRGPLHGVPIGVKDLCATKGVRTTAGSKILADNVPDEDASVVRRLREAGAVIIGKTHLHEFALGATGVNDHYGPARNAWDTDRITGGSSSGSATAVAAGLCYAALGSDTGCSIRTPSSLCGVAGIKPTYGRVSLNGVIPLSTSLDHVGPMARTVRDCALVLNAIAGHEPDDPTSADVPVEDWTADLDAGLAGLRIGVPVSYAYGQSAEDTTKLVKAAIAKLADLGAVAREIELPILQHYWMAASQVLLAEAAAYHKQHMEERADDIGEIVRQRLQAGLDMKATDYIHGANVRDQARRDADDVLLDGLDLLAMPSTVSTAVTIDSVTTDDPTLGLTLLAGMFNLTGQPAISVPCGLTDERLPVGLQLIGKRWDERTVLRAAHAYETKSGTRLPPPPID